MGGHVFPIPKPRPPPSPSHPSGSSQCTIPGMRYREHPYHASNLDWWSISHMIIYMFQCYSLKTSHPDPLLQSPKDCTIHLCLFCCLTYRVIVTIFIDSIYMHYYTALVFFFLAYFTLYQFSSVQFSRSVISDSVAPWIAACQASLSITNAQSSLCIIGSSFIHLTRTDSNVSFVMAE